MERQQRMTLSGGAVFEYHRQGRWSFMCAWHDADAVLLAERPEVKLPAVTGRKGNANKARAFPETGCLEEA